MLTLINPTANHARLKADARSRLVDGSRPLTLGWGAESDRKGAYQSACRVCISAPGLSHDTGWVEKRGQEITLSGISLPQGIESRVRIAIRDDTGEESAWLETSVINAHVDWNAPWIGEKTNEYRKTICLRREFEITKPVSSMTAYACGIGYQHITVNGKPADDAYLDPANTDYSKTLNYAVYTGLEKHLTAGKNCIGAMVASGWRQNILVTGELRSRLSKDKGLIEPLQKDKPFSGRLQLTMMILIRYADGSSEWLRTGEDWQAGFTANEYSDLFDGEIYNASLTSPGWNKAGYTGFSPAVTVDAPGGIMLPMLISPIRAMDTLSPVCSWNLEKNQWIVDFGRNIAGVLRVKLPKNLKKGDKIRLLHAEELDEDGTLYTLPLRDAKATDEYIAAGNEFDLSEWQPMFTYHGFRYALIEGISESPSVQAVELHTDLETHSFFRSGDATANLVHELCVNTERANQHSILTDCPQRDERQGWLNDATVRFEETPYNFDIGRIFPKIIHDIADTQVNGAIANTAPHVFGYEEADPVCASYLVAAMEAWMHTGNLNVVAEYYAGFAAWENHILAHARDYIIYFDGYGYNGDWAGPDYACLKDENGVITPFSAVTPLEFMYTCFSLMNLQMLKRMAQALGKEDDAHFWQETAEKTKKAILDKWYDAETTCMCTGSQACQAFSVYLHVLTGEDAARAVKRIHDELSSNGFMITTGNLCTRYLVDVLSDFGYTDDAWKLITRTEYPSIGYMIQNEATTVWERFELKKDPAMNSHSHPMYGSVDSWFFTRLLGVKPTQAGFSAFTIAPVFPKGLLSAQGVIDTVKGDISVRWMKRYGQTHLHVTVPFGCTAKITFSGKTFKAESGFHTFSQPLTD